MIADKMRWILDEQAVMDVERRADDRVPSLYKYDFRSNK